MTNLFRDLAAVLPESREREFFSQVQKHMNEEINKKFQMVAIVTSDNESPGI